MAELEYESLCALVFDELKPRIEKHGGLGVLSQKRAEFEGWMKVEFIDILQGQHYWPVPEKDGIDIESNTVTGIELKTANTNYLCEGTAYNHKPITENVNEIIASIKKLKSRPYKTRAVVFVVFPLVHNHPEWQSTHLPKIGKHLSRLDYREITFSNKVGGVIYVGQIGKTETHCFDKP